jgi:glycosyltransferase involved in cell wall biosynthesis
MGHQVELFSSEDVEGGSAFNANAGRISEKLYSASSLLWNSRARRSLSEVVRDFEPDLMHYHSIYHQLSPAVLGVAKVPTVMTLHDHKMVAPCYSLYRNSDICTECVGKKVPLPALRHRCVKGSILASAVCATEQVLYQGRYQKLVDRFIVPSEYLFEQLKVTGFDADRMSVVPWGVPGELVAHGDDPPEECSPYFLYAGRLHESKGLDQLLTAWAELRIKNGHKLLVAGGGALEGSVRAAAAADSSIRYLGVLERRHLLRFVSGAVATVVPSIVPETMGLSALESMSAGTPVILTNRGALSDLAGGGVVSVGAEDLVRELGRALLASVSNMEILSRKRAELQERDLSMYTLDAMVRRIYGVYADVLSTAGNERPDSSLPND